MSEIRRSATRGDVTVELYKDDTVKIRRDKQTTTVDRDTAEDLHAALGAALGSGGLSVVQKAGVVERGSTMIGYAANGGQCIQAAGDQHLTF